MFEHLNRVAAATAEKVSVDRLLQENYSNLATRDPPSKKDVGGDVETGENTNKMRTHILAARGGRISQEINHPCTKNTFLKIKRQTSWKGYVLLFLSKVEASGATALQVPRPWGKPPAATPFAHKHA